MDLVLVKNGGRYSLQRSSDSPNIINDSIPDPSALRAEQSNEFVNSACLNSVVLDRGLHDGRSAATDGCIPVEPGVHQRSMYTNPDNRLLDRVGMSPLMSGQVDMLSFSTPKVDSLLDSSDKLRGKLVDLGTSFVGFDKEIEEESFRKKHFEQQRMQDVHDDLLRFEKTLNVEIRRRVETNKAMQDGLDKLLSETSSSMQSRIIERFDRFAASLGSLVERCSTLEKGIQQLKGELPTKLQVDCQDIARNLKELSANFESDGKQKLDQDNYLLKVIADSGNNIDARLQQELDMTEKRCESLKSALDEFAREGDVPEGGTRAQILESVGRLRAAIRDEARTRERIDDDVVQAINEYTSALHRSLSKCVKV